MTSTDSGGMILPPALIQVIFGAYKRALEMKYAALFPPRFLLKIKVENF